MGRACFRISIAGQFFTSDWYDNDETARRAASHVLNDAMAVVFFDDGTIVWSDGGAPITDERTWAARDEAGQDGRWHPVTGMRPND